MNKVKAAMDLAKTIWLGRVNLLLLSTNLCNSQCSICNLWNAKKESLSLEVIKNLLKSKIVNKNGILLEGGEAILHPEIKEILDLFRGLNYKLLSNGLATNYLGYLVREFNIPSVGLSLDGNEETYTKIRGTNGYRNVLETIKLLKDITDLSVCFTISPGNTYEDYLHVKSICDENKVELMLNIYCESEYSGKLINKEIDKRYEKLKNPYISKYNSWVRGKIRRNCFGMRFNCNIFPNGDVVLCQAKPYIVFGNLYKNSIDEIWKNKKLSYCNDCWLACNRYLEARL